MDISKIKNHENKTMMLNSIQIIVSSADTSEHLSHWHKQGLCLSMLE